VCVGEYHATPESVIIRKIQYFFNWHAKKWRTVAECRGYMCVCVCLPFIQLPVCLTTC